MAPDSKTAAGAGGGEITDHELARTMGKTILGHPAGLGLLFTVEMWERFSYYGMRGLLVLYLTASIAVHQTAPGRYENTLRITQSPAAEGAAPKEFVQTVPLVASVGATSAAGAAPAATGEAGPLRIERLRHEPDPTHPGEKRWVPTGDLGVAPAIVAVAPGVRPEGEEVRYRVTNTGDAPVKLQLKILRPHPADRASKLAADARAAAAPGTTPEQLAKIEEEARAADDPNYKVFFKVNDSTSVISTTIGPEAKRDPRDDPFEIAIDVNRIDSGRSWTKADANSLYGWYTGMAYLLPILGGLIADRLIGVHRSMIVGALLITLGHIVLGLSGIGSMHLGDTGMSVFVAGLALITIGTGHFKPSVSVMVGDLYPRDDPRRESAFSIFYMGINLGAFLCNIVCGTLAYAYGWHYGFAAAALGMIAGLLCYVFGRPFYLRGIGETSSPHRHKAWMFLPVGIAASALVGWLFHQGILGVFDQIVSNTYVYVSLIAVSVAYAVWFVARQEPEDRGPVATIFIFMLFNAIFWLSFEQAGSSLTTFTEELTDRRLGFIWDKVPTPQFQSLNPLFIILLAPVFGMFWAGMARRGRYFPQPVKIGAGLIFVGLGSVVMFLAAMRLNTGVAKVGMIYISGCYFLHTVGEIILSPTGLSYVSKTAPKRHMSSLMGIWFISSFIAGLAAGKVGALVDPIIEGTVKLPWNFGGQADFFLLFVVTSVAAGVLIIALTPILRRLQRNPND